MKTFSIFNVRSFTATLVMALCLISITSSQASVPEAVTTTTAIALPTTYSWKVEGDQEHAALGTSLATAGDVNGDGYADVFATAVS